MEEIKHFLATASAHGVLTKEEEQDLLRKAQAGDKRAREKIIKHNIRLVMSIAKKFLNRGMDFEDLLQEGSIGCNKAIDKFEIDRGHKFSTYASWWIRQGISRAIENKGKTIRIPIHQLSKITKIKKVYRKYVEEHQEIPTSEEIAILCNITQDEAEEFRKMQDSMMSLDAPASSDDMNLTLMDYVADDTARSTTEDGIEFNTDRTKLQKAIKSLPQEYQVIIQYKYNFLDYKTKTDEECAEAFQTSVEEIQMLLKIIMNKLRLAISREEFCMEEGVGEAGFNLIVTRIPLEESNRVELMYILKDFGYTMSQVRAFLTEVPAAIQTNISMFSAKELADRLAVIGVTTAIVRK